MFNFKKLETTKRKSFIIFLMIFVCFFGLNYDVNAVEECDGLNGTCGGNLGDQCYPEAECFATLLYYDVSSNWAIFCVSSSGSGWSWGNQGGQAYGVSVTFQELPGGTAWSTNGGFSVNAAAGSGGECVSGFNDCSIYKTSVGPGSVVEFKATGLQIGKCWCSSTFQLTMPTVDVEYQFPLEANSTELGVPDCEQQFGNPINLTNGNKFLVMNDLLIGNDFGLPINFTRYYNSYTSREGILGGNWSHSYEYSFDIDASGNVTLHTGNGKDVIFTKIDNNGVITYKSNYGSHFELGIDYSNPSFIVYNFENQNGLEIKFSRDAFSTWISSFSDINGNQVIPAYNSSGLLIKLTDESNRFINFYYNTANKLERIESMWDALLIGYEYNTTTGYLERVTNADGSWEYYNYEIAPVGNPRNISQRSNSDGFVWNYLYNSAGLATSTYGVDNINRRDIVIPLGIDTICPITYNYSLEYNGIALNNRTVEATWNHDYDYKIIKNNTDPDCSSCGTDYEYDRNGNKKLITYKNSTEDARVYDTKGNLTQEIKAINFSNISQEKIIEYDPEFNLPTKIYYPSIVQKDINPNEWDTLFFTYDANANLLTYTEYGWESSSLSYSHLTTFDYTNGQLYRIDGPTCMSSEVFGQLIV